MCPYKHTSVEKDLQIGIKNDDEKVPKNEVIKKVQNKNDKKENVQDVILKAFKKESEEHYNVNQDCGLNNKCQKCSRCNFITHSMGLLRIHEKKSHKLYHNFDKVVDGFKFDSKKYFEVLSAMYDGDDLYRNQCDECNFKA